MNAVGLFESPTLRDTIRTQFKQIKSSTTTVETVLAKLAIKLNEKYTTTQNTYEIVVKVDKRKNLDTVKKEVQGILNDIEVSFDMVYMFKVMSGPNEIVVRARRNK